MMFRKFNARCVFIAALMSITTHAAQTTEVIINGVEQHLAQPLYLADLWQHLDAPEAVYWPGAALYVDDEEILQLRQQVLQKLSIRTQLLRQAANTDEAVAVENLANWLVNLKLGRRVKLTLDYERSRHVKSANPLLQNNRFYLSAKLAAQSIELIGAVSQQQYQASIEQVITAKQLHRQFATGHADNSWLYWSVGGDWQRAGIAYWNHKQKLQFSAGSSIFIPFSTEVLGDDTEWVNRQVLTILKSRIR